MDKKEAKEREKGEKIIAKAEFLFSQEKYRKAADQFMKAGEMYFKIGEWQIAEKCFLFGAKSFIALERFKEGSDLLRLSANCCLMMDELAKARDYYDSAAKNAIRSTEKDQDMNSLLNICFAYLTHFLMGQHDKAIQYIAKMKQYIDIDDFNENPLVQLVKNLTSAILNGSEDALYTAVSLYPKFKFRAAENRVIKMALVLASCYVEMEISMEINKTEFVNDSVIEMLVGLGIEDVLKDTEKDLQGYDIKSVTIKDIVCSVSDNLALLTKFELPMKFSDAISIPLQIKTTFPGKGYIGPIVFLLEIEDKYRFYANSDDIKINVKSPDAVLSINFEALQTPIINQKFPVRVTLKNNSDGEAVDLNVKFEFPEELKMMRGTFDKKIFALGSHEDIKWEIFVKSSQPGKIPIKTAVDYKDPDGKSYEQLKFTNDLEINL